MFDHQEIEGKDVYTVESHHHALLPWSRIRERLSAPPNLITLDHHTDTIEAFSNHLYLHCGFDKGLRGLLKKTLFAELNWRDVDSVQKAIDRLKYDEHIQTATLGGILNYAFVINLNSSGTESVEEADAGARWDGLSFRERRSLLSHPPQPASPLTYKATEDRIFIVPHTCTIGCERKPHNEECWVAQCNQVLESDYLLDQLKRAQDMATCVGIIELQDRPFVLDIDLDFFHTAKAVAPNDPTTFHNLIRNASAITIAIEPGCTLGLMLEGENLNIEFLLSRIYQHIREACRRSDP